MVKLSDRKDKTGVMSKEVVMVMIEKIFAFKKMQTDFIRERKQTLIKIKQKYDQKINDVEKDIYKLENAVKLVTGASDYYRLKQEYQESLRTDIPDDEPPKDLNTSQPDDNKDNNNNKEDD